MQARVETSFQAANTYSSFDLNFGGTDQEGRIVGCKHNAKIGEGIWLSKCGISIVVRNDVLDDGSWKAIWIFAI